MLMINLPAPQFTSEAVFENQNIKEIKLSDFKGSWLVLFFYPLDFTTVCPTEILQFRDHLSDFKKLNSKIVGCSVDSVYSHQKWIQDELKELGFPLMSDLTKNISRDYNALLEDQGISTRATFIIDPDQNVQFVGYHNLNVGRDAKEILRVLQALQSGEMCAAGWKPGDKFLK